VPEAIIPITCPADAVINAAMSPKKPNVYFIGPYGSRVSFASQQRRALNTIWAIHDRGKWPTAPETTAAVIGGGIAGVVTATALSARGCAVRIYEEKGRALNLQARASHRGVHPSLNFWPEEPLAPTTSFRFLDWYAGTCTKALKDIRAEWEAVFSRRVAPIRNGKRVVDLRWDKRRQQVSIHLLGGEVEYADIAFVTTGFGKERDLADPERECYWHPDLLDDLAEDTTKRCLVSGIGDGGIIDALRLTYPGFMTNEVALRYLLKVDTPQLRKRVEKIEKDAAAIADLDQRAEFYWKHYDEVARDRGANAQALLPRFPEGRHATELVGQLVRPFQRTTAPIHKIILAHALRERQIEYIYGTVTRSDRDYWLKRTGGKREPLIRDEIVIRHGPVPPLATFLGPKEADELRRRQQHTGDFLDIRIPDDFFDFGNDFPSFTANPRRFLSFRRKLAGDFLKERHDLGLSLPTDRGEHCFIAHPKPDQEPRNMSALPSAIFGVPLTRSDELVATLDDALDWSQD
jgi:hypothetical protein